MSLVTNDKVYGARYIQNARPNAPQIGDIWYKPSENILYYYGFDDIWHEFTYILGDLTELDPTDFNYDLNYSKMMFLLQGNYYSSLYHFYDSSVYNHKINVNGDARLSLDKSKFGNSSMYFPSTNKSRATFPPGSIDLSIGTWTIDMWFYLLDISGIDKSLLNSDETSSYYTQLSCYINGTGKLCFVATISGSLWEYQHVSSFTVPIDQWNYLAIIRFGYIYYYIFNGQFYLLWNTNTSLYLNLNTKYALGGSATYNTSLNGYIDEFRFIKDVALHKYILKSPTQSIISSSYIPNVMVSYNADVDNIIDYSPNSFALTKAGDTMLSTTQIKFGTKSLYIPSTNRSRLIFPANAINLSTGDFTLEFWVYCETLSGARRLVYASNISNHCQISIGMNGVIIQVYMSTNGTSWTHFNSAITTLSTGVWYHIALMRHGDLFYLKINDSLYYIATYSGALYHNDTYQYTIGGSSDNDFSLSGYFDEFRIIKGNAIYLNENNINVPSTQTEVKNDAYNEYVKLLVNVEGIYGSSTIRALTEKTYLIPYNVTIGHVGGYNAFYFNGSNSYIQIADSDNIVFGSQDFVIEFWAYLPTSSARRCFIGKCNSTGSSALCEIWFECNTTNTVTCWPGNGSTYDTLGTDLLTFPSNTWFHVVQQRRGNKMEYYLDGILKDTKTIVIGAFYNAPNPITIGRGGDYNGCYFYGYMRNIRITLGETRYTSNFTPEIFPLTFNVLEQYVMTYKNYVLSLQPLAFYPMIETSGTKLYDYSGNNWYGTYLGTDIEYSNLPLVNEDANIWYNTRGYSASQIPNVLYNEMGLSFYFMASGTQQQYAKIIAHAQIPAAANANFPFSIEYSDGKMKVILSRGNDMNIDLSAEYDISVETIYHVVVNFTTTFLTVWINGVKQIPIATGFALSSYTGDWTFGMASENGGTVQTGFAGNIGYVVFRQTIFTDNEISLLKRI